MGVFQHTWLQDYLGRAVHITGDCLFSLSQGLSTVLGFVGF